MKLNRTLILPREEIMKLIARYINENYPSEEGWKVHEFDLIAIPNMQFQTNPLNKLGSWKSLKEFEKDEQA